MLIGARPNGARKHPGMPSLRADLALRRRAFDAWLEQTAKLDREARTIDSYAVASLIFDEIEFDSSHGERGRTGRAPHPGT